ncbi:DUF1700 domain-containing protein [Barrientosiimonas marina]|uniref:DUF1700 domain-containing protein n=1 Tax=Lentibacillus kimchii TaxID=1542911 RepID=A0ABW2UQB4_9BACI
MNKQTFMKELNHYLNGLPAEEKRDINQDFDEHFSAGAKEGKSEFDIAAGLGSPRQIGKEMRAAYQLETVDSDNSVSNVLRAVWAVIGLGFFNLVIVLGPVLALAGIGFAGWVVGVSFTATPLLVLVNALLFPATFIWFDVFFSLLLSGVGILIGIGMYYLTRLFIQGIIKYLHFNVNAVKGGVSHA